MALSRMGLSVCCWLSSESSDERTRLYVDAGCTLVDEALSELESSVSKCGAAGMSHCMVRLRRDFADWGVGVLLSTFRLYFRAMTLSANGGNGNILY